ncbi:MAG: SPFH domain-containing protein [Gemmatimonadota bacterium]|jgi:regulator of protease activity HflC (stomatin/prohibitin superfamily)
MAKYVLPFVLLVPEYQRVAVFRLGRIVGYRGPGIVLRAPIIEEFQVVDSRVVTVDVQPQECITRDNVPIELNAVVYYKVEHPDMAIVEVADYRQATIEVAQSTLRSVIGQRTLDDVLTDIKGTAGALKTYVDEATDSWGVKVSRVEIKDIRIPADMKRAMAIEAEAERERRAMVIRASGEREAATELAEAARVLDATPSGFQIRFLQTLLRVAENGNTVIFADPNQAAAAAAAGTMSAVGPGRVPPRPAPHGESGSP